MFNKKKTPRTSNFNCQSACYSHKAKGQTKYIVYKLFFFVPPNHNVIDMLISFNYKFLGISCSVYIINSELYKNFKLDQGSKNKKLGNKGGPLYNLQTYKWIFN